MWNMQKPNYTPEELAKKILRNKPYFKRNNGGVTFSGGEPLLQSEFVIEVCKLLKKEGIHIALDTSGVGNGNYEETLMIITMCGLDVDCNAAMIMPIVAIPQGMRIIPNRLIHPVFEVLRTYMREYRKFSLEELVDDTLSSIKKALERRNTK
jgi:hypothetical protein